jgi:hypothetical protein
MAVFQLHMIEITGWLDSVISFDIFHNLNHVRLGMYLLYSLL